MEDEFLRKVKKMKNILRKKFKINFVLTMLDTFLLPGYAGNIHNAARKGELVKIRIAVESGPGIESIRNRNKTYSRRSESGTNYAYIK